MQLVLRKCRKNGYSSNGFYYGQVGERVNCPDWKPTKECGNGLHGLLKCKGNWHLLEGDDWLLIDVDGELVEIDSEKCKFNTGIIVYRGDSSGLINFIDHLDIQNYEAYYWARYIGNQEEMKDRINDSESAYMWAKNIGNKDEMKEKITDSEHAYLWARNIGNEEEMKEKITESLYAYKWARFIGNQEEMKEKITESRHAYLWAFHIVTYEKEMKEKITESEDVYFWVDYVNPNDKEYFINKFPKLASSL